MTQTTISASGSSAGLADAGRAIRILAILLLLMGWFVVVGALGAATIVRNAVISGS